MSNMTGRSWVCAFGALAVSSPAFGDLYADDYVATIGTGAPIAVVHDVAQVGPDAVGNWLGQIGYDLEARTIRVESLITDPAVWVQGLVFEFSDLNPGGVITGARVIASGGAGWSLINDSDVSFTATTVRIDASKIGNMPISTDQFVTVELEFVTAPDAAALRVYESLAPSIRDAIWQVDTSNATLSNPVMRAVPAAVAGFEWGRGAYYAHNTNVKTDLLVIDPATGVATSTIILSFPPGGDVLTSLEFVGDTLYAGLATEGGGVAPSTLVTIDLNTGVVSTVGAMGINGPTGGLAWDGSRMYTVNSGASGVATLYAVNLATGAATPVGLIRDVANGAQVTLTGLEFGANGVLYGLGRGPNDNQLFAINPMTGAAALLGTLPPANFHYTSLTTAPSMCPADLAPPPNGDGSVDTNDFFQFLAYYQAQDPAADFAPPGGDGNINTNDFFAFLAAYQAGCR